MSLIKIFQQTKTDIYFPYNYKISFEPSDLILFLMTLYYNYFDDSYKLN